MNIQVTAILILLGGWLAGRLFKACKLPPIMGMVLYGVVLSSTLKDVYPLNSAPFLKSMALIIILVRAGLGISKATLQKIGFRAILLSVVPCLFEATSLILLAHYGFGYAWAIAGMTAFMLSAVSPAVIVPSMLAMKVKGMGKKNEVPTLILAGASVDDVIAITCFSLFLSLAIGTENTSSIEQSIEAMSNFFIFWQIFSIILSIAGGIIGGILCGFALVWFFKCTKLKINTTEATLVLVMMSVLLVQIGGMLHIAALLGVMTVGFVLLEKAEELAHKVAKKLSHIWIIAEIILFVLIGMAVDIPTALQAGLKGLMLIAVGLTARSIGVVFSLAGSQLNWRERLFCVIAYLPKATVQAALGSIALENGLAEGNEILSFAVLAIIVTAPLGLLGINISGKYLLKD